MSSFPASPTIAILVKCLTSVYLIPDFRLNGTPSPTTPQYDYLSHLNRNKKQKVYSDEEEIAEDDEIHHEIDHHLSPPNPPGVEDDGNNSDDERSGIKGLTEEEWTQVKLLKMEKRSRTNSLW